MTTQHAPAPRRRTLDRIGVIVIVICGGLALSILAWAASLPDGLTN